LQGHLSIRGFSAQGIGQRQHFVQLLLILRASQVEYRPYFDVISLEPAFPTLFVHVNWSVTYCQKIDDPKSIWKYSRAGKLYFARPGRVIEQHAARKKAAA